MKPTTEIVQQCQELTTAEVNTLQACEADINKGGELIATALQKIRDQRLYRAEFATFEDYCRERLNKSRRWVNQQIMHIEVIANITEHLSEDGQSLGTIVPKMTEAATRELAGLEPEEQAEVVKTIAYAGEKPTASTVKRVASQKKAEKKPPHKPDTEIVDAVPPEAKPASRPVGAEIHDHFGLKVPAKLVPSAALAARLAALVNLIRGVKREWSELANLPGGEYLPDVTALDGLVGSVNGARYMTACPKCNGDGCNSCRNHGWLRHGMVLSDELKKLLIEAGADKEKLL